MVDLAAIAKDLRRDEGFVGHAYRDHLGYLTIGFGRLIDERKAGGVTPREAARLLDNDILYCLKDLDRNIEWWRRLPEFWMRALVEMRFQLGWKGLAGFKRMLAALQAHDGKSAYDHALDSKWAREDTPERALRVASLFLKREPVEGR